MHSLIAGGASVISTLCTLPSLRKTMIAAAVPAVCARQLRWIATIRSLISCRSQSGSGVSGNKWFCSGEVRRRFIVYAPAMLLRALGVCIAIAGVVLACAPTLVHDPGPAVDTYAAIERRVWWGAMTGLGALLIVRTRLKPWKITLAHVVGWIVAGFLLARVIGLVLDGWDSAMQWVWTVVEIVIVALAAWYVRTRSLSSEAHASPTPPPTLSDP